MSCSCTVTRLADCYVKYYEESDEVKERWQFPKKRGDGWLRGNVPFPNWVRRDEELGRYRECRDGESDSDGCIVVPSMFFAVWYDVSNHTFFSLEDGDYFTLASGNGKIPSQTAASPNASFISPSVQVKPTTETS